MGLTLLFRRTVCVERENYFSFGGAFFYSLNEKLKQQNVYQWIASEEDLCIE